jgi:hypothetical protein
MRFDIATMEERVAPVRVDDLDLGAFRDQPLDEDVLRCLRAMHDVEHHTICYLRDVLVTDAHRDVEVTTFLTFWVFEEHWHGQALGRVLAAHGEDPEARRRQVRADVTGRGGHDRRLPLYTWLANRVSRHVPAAHMTWGAVNEWTTQAAYARLGARAGHPVLAELLGRIRRQEGRHIDFYASQAHDRLEGSRTAQRATRLALRRFWAPVGSGVLPEAETRHLASYLFGGPEGEAVTARIDRHVDRLPGLAGLGLLTGAARRLAAPG